MQKRPVLRRGLCVLWALVAGSAGSVQSQSARAANVGPPLVAKAERRLWPEEIATRRGFDKASRAALLVYLHALYVARGMPDAELGALLQVDTLDARRVLDPFFRKAWAASVQNYQLAAASGCSSTDWTCPPGAFVSDEFHDGAAAALARVPAGLQAWRTDMEGFAHAYLAEQLRLAAVFPRVNSEIDTFNEREWNGDRLPDRQFFLSLDDGPTVAGGNTDAVLAMLAAENKSAVFFVLGENFQRRRDKWGPEALRGLYANQCVASHGWEHKSHARWPEWQDSVKRTQAAIVGTIRAGDALALFRPPYGQRLGDSEAFFRSQSLHVALWNLDSLDWSSHLDAADAASRVVALMLIKRHGVVLFHDIHHKAKVALPIIFREVGAAVEWGDCHGLGQL